jgi:hypothetical protein
MWCAVVWAGVRISRGRAAVALEFEYGFRAGDDQDRIKNPSFIQGVRGFASILPRMIRLPRLHQFLAASRVTETFAPPPLERSACISPTDLSLPDDA